MVDVVTSFRKAAARYGLPASPLSDNGAMFTGASRGAGESHQNHELAAHNISFRHPRPYHPQTYGRSNAPTKPSNYTKPWKRPG